MNFSIDKIIIWFGKDDAPRVLHFEKNKINVITGDSSTGKSNIIAIINYCLLSGQSNIVEPIVNQFTSWYGLEFTINGKVYSIARKHPELETTISDVYFQEGSFGNDFRPTNTNLPLEGARKMLNSLLGYKSHKSYYQFRRNFIFNILTEDIIANPYIYLNRSFFLEESYSEDECIKVFEDIISPNTDKLQELRDESAKLQKETKKQIKINNQVEEFEKLLSRCISILTNSGLLTEDVKQLPYPLQLNTIFELITSVKGVVDAKNEDTEKQLYILRQTLFRESLHYSELINTQNQYSQYKKRLNEYTDSIAPIEQVKGMLQNQDNAIWAKYVVDSLSKSLSSIKSEITKSEFLEKSADVHIAESKAKINELKNKIKELESLASKYSLDAPSFRSIGMVEEILRSNEKLLNPNFNLTREDIADDEKRIVELEAEIAALESKDYGKWNKLDSSFQAYFDICHSIDYYEGAKTTWDRKNQVLKLRGKDEGFNYSVIGSQSNYMFMHLFFFLGLHTYLLENLDSKVFQFLFVDQPSIPYYEGNVDVKSTDRSKLEDAFSLLNAFMKHVTEDLHKSFQIILIEHAPESYWNNDKYKFFTTCETFLNGNALIPQNIIRKYSNNE